MSTTRIKLLLLLLCTFLLTSCVIEQANPSLSNDKPESQIETKAKLNIAAMRGPTALGLLRLFEDASLEEAINDYDILIAGSPDEITVSLIRGETDIAAVPVNLAAILYNRTEGEIRVIALNTLGVLYFIENGNEIHSINDLRGKTLFNMGKGTTPEFSLNYVLAQNGISEAELIIEYRHEATEIAALLEAGAANLALLPEPFVSTVLARNPNLRIALSLTEEWAKVSNGTGLVTGAVVVRNSFLLENPDAVSAFLDEYRRSVEFTKTNLSETASLATQWGIIPNTNIAEVAIPNCNIVFIEGAEMKHYISAYLSVLYAADPASVGGSLPSDSFYYIR
jgi:NitT/TauT family transport system substrate-binding protein